MSRRRENLLEVVRSPSMELDEMIPVDNFFDDYVARLQHPYFDEEGIRTSNAGHGGFHMPLPDATEPPFPPFGPFESKLEETEHSVFAPVSHQLQDPFPTSNPAVHQERGLFADPEYYSGPMLDSNHPLYAESSADNVISTGAPGEALPQLPLNDAFFPSQLEAHGTNVHTQVRGGISKSRLKSARQQQLNKLAQQRYRERKKAKAAGLERQVEALTDQLTQLSAVREEKLTLEEKNLNLERKLLEKEAELSSLRSQLEEAKKAPGANNSSAETAYHQDERPRVVGTDSKVAMMFHRKVQDLRNYLENNGLDQSVLSTPLEHNVGQNHVDAIRSLVGEVCKVCMQLSRHDGPDLWDLISANLDKKKTHDRSVWRKIAQDLRLNKDQIETGFRLREQHLMKLETIYIQRQSLNLEAIKLLLPQDQGGKGPPPQQLGCFSIAGFIQRVRHTSKVNQCLDKLKENLSNEQKLNSDLEYMTFYRVMTPLQGAWFTLSAYPHQCDCLAFLNAVFELYGMEVSRNQDTGSN